MSKVPDAWEDEWSATVDTAPTPPCETSKKASSKASKAQRRAQQAEFNRQLWAEAEGPRETNYFLESRNIVPLRSEFKPPPILLSRKGPIVQSQSPRPLTVGLQDLNLNEKNHGAESSEDEEELKAREQTLAERQAQAARDREEKQRKYDERRQELFGNAGTASNNSSPSQQVGYNRSGTSSPSSLTPPGSRSATPNRGRGGKSGRRGGGGGGGIVGMGLASHNANSRTQSRGSQHRDLYDPSYGPKPDSVFLQRRVDDGFSPNTTTGLVSGSGTRAQAADAPIQPIRAPRGPDGSGRGGFGFIHPRPSSVIVHPENPATKTSTSVASLPAASS